MLVQLNMISRFSESQNSVLMHPGVVFGLLFLKSCCCCVSKIHSFLSSDLMNCVVLAAISISSPVLSSCTSRPISNPLSTPLFNHSISHCFPFIFCSIPLSACGTYTLDLIVWKHSSLGLTLFPYGMHRSKQKLVSISHHTTPTFWLHLEQDSRTTEISLKMYGTHKPK